MKSPQTHSNLQIDHSISRLALITYATAIILFVSATAVGQIDRPRTGTVTPPAQAIPPVPTNVPALPERPRTIHVPGDYPTLQAAIDAGRDGDKIIYNSNMLGPLDTRGKRIILSFDEPTSRALTDSLAREPEPNATATATPTPTPTRKPEPIWVNGVAVSPDSTTPLTDAGYLPGVPNYPVYSAPTYVYPTYVYPTYAPSYYYPNYGYSSSGDEYHNFYTLGDDISFSPLQIQGTAIFGPSFLTRPPIFDRSHFRRNLFDLNRVRGLQRPPFRQHVNVRTSVPITRAPVNRIPTTSIPRVGISTSRTVGTNARR